MDVRKIGIAALLIISLAAAIIAYPAMPDTMATHWGFDGNADGFSGKALGTFLFPALTWLIVLLMLGIPYLDPLKKNIDAFRKEYETSIILFGLFFTALQLQVYLWNIGIMFGMNQVMAVAMGILFYGIGILLKKAKRNYFIGIRTPWTLSSDAVWDETHRVSSLLFRASAALCVIGLLFPRQAFLFILVPILCASLFSVVYSYVVFRRLRKKRR